MLYDLERLKLRIYERRGSCTEDEVDLQYGSLTTSTSTAWEVGGRERDTIALPGSGENRTAFSRVKADGDIF